MKKIVIGIIFGLAVGALATRLLSEFTTKPAAAAAEAPEPPKPNPTKFPPAKRAAAGITLGRPSAASLAPEVRGFGRVLDATPYLSLVAEGESAAAAHDGSAKDLDRLKKLYANDSNVSAQAVEAAEAAEARDRVALTSARMRLANSWGHGLVEATITEALEKGASLVRLDILPGDTPGGTPKTATVTMFGSDEVLPAEILGTAPTADPQMQGLSYIALVRDHQLPAGASLRITVMGQGESTKALVIPRMAVVYHQGSPWIYVLGEEDTFFRRLVALGRSTPDGGVVIADGLNAEEQVAITGAQQLLSAELQAGDAAEDE